MERFLSQIASLEPTNGLSHRIMARIEREVVKRARIRLTLESTTITAAALALAQSLSYAVTAGVESGLGSYLSLLVSDPDVVYAHAGTFALSILEASPLFFLSVATAATLAIALGARSALTSLPRVRLSASLLAHA